MKMKFTSCFLVLLLALSVKFLHAQCPPASCTSSTIKGPNVVTAGSIVYYSLDLTDNLFTSWNVIGGTVVNGPPTGNTIAVIWNSPGIFQVNAFPQNLCAGQTPPQKTVTIVNQPSSTAPAISGPNAVCLNQPTTYTVPAIAGKSISWNYGFYSMPFQPLPSFAPPVIAISGNSLTITWINTCPMPPMAQLYIFAAYTDVVTNVTGNFGFKPIPLTAPIPIISGPNPEVVCPNSSESYSVTNLESGSIVEWQLVSGGILTTTGNNASVNWTTTGGPYVLTATVVNSCFSNGGSSGTKTVNVSSAAIATPEIIGPDKVCKNIPATFTLANLQPGNSVKWSAKGANIDGPANQPSVLISWPKNGAVTLTATVTNSCGTSSAGTKSLSITSTIPAKPGPITKSPTEPCIDTQVSFSVAPVTGATSYEWQFSGPSNFAATTTTSNYTTSFTIPGNYDISVKALIGGCSSIASTMTMNVCGSQCLPAPCTSATIKGPNVVAVGTIVYYSLDLTDNLFTMWNAIGGTIVNGPPTGNTIAVIWNSPGIFQVNAFPENLCAGQTPPQKTVTVVSQPSATAPAISGPNTVCLNQSTTYTVPAIVGKNVSWNYGFYSMPFQTFPLPSFVPPVVAISGNSLTITWINTCPMPPMARLYIFAAYTDAVTNVTGNFGLKPISLTAPVPIISGPNPEVVCNNSQSTYSITNFQPGDVVSWNLSGGGTKSESANMAIINWNTVGGPYTLSATVTSSCGSPSVPSSKSINVISNANINGPTVECKNAIVTYTTEPGQSNYNWSIMGGTINSGQGTNSVIVTWSTSGLQTIAVEYTSNSCSLAGDKTITVKDTPTVTTGDQVICSMASTSLTLSSSLPGSAFSWTVKSASNVTGASSGSGSVINQVLTCTPQASVSGTVIYTVTATANGCTGPPKDITITVKQRPLINTLDKTICSGASTNLALASNPTGSTFTWTTTPTNVTGSASGSGLVINQTLTSSAGGNVVYGVTPTLSGCTGPKGNVTVTVNPLPSVTADNKSVCSGNSIPLTGGPVGGTWSGAGVSGSTFNSSGLSIGDHQITYTFTDPNGCTNYATAIVTVNPSPPATITPDGPTTFCEGGSVTLNANSGAGLTYQWKVNGSNISGVTGSSYLASTAGNYTVSVSNSSSCSQTSSPIQVNINPLPSVTADNKSVCSGSVPLTGTPSGGTWSGTGVSGSTFYSSGLSPGNYSVTYTYTNANGCTNSANATVTVSSLPSVTADNKSVCQGSVVGLTGTPSGGTWSGTGVNGSTFFSFGLTPGTYPVTYTYTHSNGCTNSANSTVTVNAAPVITTFTGTGPVCPGNSYTYTATLLGGHRPEYTYTWTKPANWTIEYQHQGTIRLYVPMYNPNYGAVSLKVSNGYCFAQDGITAYPGSCGEGYYYFTATPNPAMDILTIEWVEDEQEGFENTDISNSLQSYTVELTNGYRGIKQTSTERLLNINTTSLPRGLYILKVTSGGKVTTERILLK